MRIREVGAGTLQVSDRGVNQFLVFGEEGPVLVDAGMRERGTAAVRRALARRGSEERALVAVLVTHYHPDHTGGLAALGAVGAPIAVPAGEAEVVRTGADVPVAPPPPVLLPRVMHRLLTGRRAAPASRVDTEVRDGDVLPGGFRAIATPGHTRGHVSYLLEDAGILFAGDAASGYAPHPGWTIMYEDLDASFQSLHRLAELDFEIAVFGHGRPVVGRDRFRAGVEAMERRVRLGRPR